MLPLEGIRVCEMGESEGIGMAALLFSDLGASVTKIEASPSSPGRICDRGKRRVHLDLNGEQDKNRLLALLEETDVLLDGLPAGGRRTLGLSGEALKEAFPRLVTVSLSPYGQEGPLRGRPFSEACVQAESGFVSTTGPEGGEPVRCGGDIASFAGGMMACIAALMGILGRDKQGLAREMDVSMMDTILFGLENQFSLYLKTGIVPRPRGNRYALSAPVGNFTCKDGGEIMVSVATEAQWAAFAKTLDRLAKDVQEAFSCFARSESIERLQARGCIYGCINDFPAVYAHPQTRAKDVASHRGRRGKAPPGSR